MAFSPPTMPFSPPVVYPNTVTTQPASHSKGSFGPVFAVLGVILVLSAIACFLGQLCARRCSRSKARGDHHPRSREDHHPKAKGDHHPKHRGDRDFHSEEGDIEFGFKKKIPKGKSSGHGENRGPKPTENGESREESKTAENTEARASGR